MLKKLLFISFLYICISGCSNSDIDILEVQATIIDVRETIGLESCEWLLDIDGTLYKPSYLPPSYEVEGLRVLAKIELLNTKANCGSLNNQIETIRIEQISTAN